MKDKSEQMPERIFAWLEKRDFSSLREDEMAEVLKYISEPEYMELRSAAMKLQPLKKINASKEMLLSEFDREHHRKPLRPQMFIWKAAAMLFLVSSLLLSGFLLRNRQHGDLSASIIHDTVFVMKETQLAAEKIIDTVYLISDSHAALSKSAGPASVRTRISGRTVYQEDEMNTMNYEDLEQEEKRQKKNSIKHDTLLKKYPFVSTL